MSTVVIPPDLSSPRDDAIKLKAAFQGFGCNTKEVVRILAHRDAMQRAIIQQEYRALYGDELAHRLSSELSGDLKKAVLLWLYDPATRDATILKKALSENNLDLKAATEVVCSRTPTQLQHLRGLYLAMFGGYLEHDIETHASGSHKKLLLAYITMPRYEGPEIDSAIVVEDAKALYKAGEKRIGTDDKTFRRIFSERSRAHLAAVSATYNQNHGNSLEKAIKGETSRHFCYALKAILHCAENPGLFFAKIMYKAMKGMGTNDTTLIRIIVTRAEIDMAYIKSEYHRKYGKSLHDVVHSETSSHYRTFLLSLIGHPPAY